MTVGNTLTFIIAIIALIISIFGNIGLNGSVSIGEPKPSPVVSVAPSVVTPEISEAPASPSAAINKFVPTTKKVVPVQ